MYHQLDVEAIPDYRDKKKLVVIDLRESDEAGYTAAGLKDLPSSELAQGVASRRQRREALSKKDAVPARTANREIVLALGQGMRAVRAQGLSLFAPQQNLSLIHI